MAKDFGIFQDSAIKDLLKLEEGIKNVRKGDKDISDLSLNLMNIQKEREMQHDVELAFNAVCCGGNMKLIKYFIENNLISANGSTHFGENNYEYYDDCFDDYGPLHDMTFVASAARAGQTNVVRYLLDNGADPKNGGLFNMYNHMYGMYRTVIPDFIIELAKKYGVYCENFNDGSEE